MWHWLQPLLRDKNSMPWEYVWLCHCQSTALFGLRSLSLPCLTVQFIVSSAFPCLWIFLSDAFIWNKIFSVWASYSFRVMYKKTLILKNCVKKWYFLIQVPCAGTHLLINFWKCSLIFCYQNKFPISEIVWVDRWV